MQSQVLDYFGLGYHHLGKSWGGGQSKTVLDPSMTFWRILDAANVKPYRIRYYLEKRNPEFDQKMVEVQIV